MSLFETERLVVRRWCEKDVEDLLCIYGDLEVTRYIPELAVRNERDVLANMPRLLSTYVKYGCGYGVFALERRDDHRAIGTLLFKPAPDRAFENTEDIELGWHLGRDYWGRGYATEAVQGLIAYAFGERGIRELVAFVHEPNTRSVRLAKRVGLVSCGPTTEYYGGEEVGLYRLTAESWKEAGKIIDSQE